MFHDTTLCSFFHTKKGKILWIKYTKSSNFGSLNLHATLLLSLFIACLAQITQKGSMRIILLEIYYFFKPFILYEHAHGSTECNFKDVGLEVILCEAKVEVGLRVLFDIGEDGIRVYFIDVCSAVSKAMCIFREAAFLPFVVVKVVIDVLGGKTDINFV
jgi:hypothetical protein